MLFFFSFQFSLPSPVSITRFDFLLEYNVKYNNESSAFSPVLSKSILLIVKEIEIESAKRGKRPVINGG